MGSTGSQSRDLWIQTVLGSRDLRKYHITFLPCGVLNHSLFYNLNSTLKTDMIVHLYNDLFWSTANTWNTLYFCECSMLHLHNSTFKAIYSLDEFLEDAPDDIPYLICKIISYFELLKNCWKRNHKNFSIVLKAVGFIQARSYGGGGNSVSYPSRDHRESLPHGRIQKFFKF